MTVNGRIFLRWSSSSSFSTYKRLRWAATLRIWRSGCCCLWFADWLTDCILKNSINAVSIWCLFDLLACRPFMLALASFFGFRSVDYVCISSWFYYLFFLSISSCIRTRSIFSHPKKLNWIDSKIHRKSIAVNWRLRGGLSRHNIKTQHNTHRMPPGRDEGEWSWPELSRVGAGIAFQWNISYNLIDNCVIDRQRVLNIRKKTSDLTRPRQWNVISWMDISPSSTPCHRMVFIRQTRRIYVNSIRNGKYFSKW